jgi:hypothetical protein
MVIFATNVDWWKVETHELLMREAGGLGIGAVADSVA